METLSSLELAYLATALVIAYAIRGSAGFSSGTVPLLAVVLSLKIAVPLVNFLGLFSSAAILAKDHRFIVWREVKRLILACIVGTLLGLYFFKTLDATHLRRILGVIVVGYAGHTFWSTIGSASKRKLKLSLGAAIPVAGTLAGFVGTLFNMAGMFFAIYLDLLKFAKKEFRATMAATVFTLGLLRGAGYAAVGAYDSETLMACAVALPMMAIGVVIGNHIHANLNQVWFTRLVAGVLILSGTLLLLR
jgi:uncharacterized protein